uniref:Uncharacterized protein n=1 Tax=Neogobius melanostomus TaxID=47308 RepID=A0A8C6U663_9GOBI
MNFITRIRFLAVTRSIKGLKDHFRKNSATSGALYSLQSRPNAKRRPPRSSRRDQVKLRPKHYSQHGLDGKKGGSNLTPLEGKDDVLDIEIDSYIHCISAFVKLAQSEYSLLCEIIPEHHQKKTFDSLIQVTPSAYPHTGDSILTPFLHTLIQPAFLMSLCPGTAASTKNKLPGSDQLHGDHTAKALEEFADSIKNDPDKEYNMPKDRNGSTNHQQRKDHTNTGTNTVVSESSSSCGYSGSSSCVVTLGPPRVGDLWPRWGLSRRDSGSPRVGTRVLLVWVDSGSSRVVTLGSSLCG